MSGFHEHIGELAPLKIGFVYVAPLTEAGWVRQHEEGRKAVQAALETRRRRAALRARLGLPAEGPVAVSVRRLVPRMGLDVAIEETSETLAALARVRD